MDFFGTGASRIGLILAAVLLLVFYISREQPKVEKMEEEAPEMIEEEEPQAPEYQPASSEELKATESGPAQAPEMSGSSDTLTSEDLLPKSSEAGEFADRFPEGAGPLADKNFLTAGYHSGINTVGTSLRNANVGIRSEPPNPTTPLSPWNNTTITPDLGRRPLELSEC